MRRMAHAAAAIAITGCLLLASACGGNPEPQPLPKSEKSPSASTSPSPSATPPAMPAAAREKTKAGAVSFARHYVRLINHAQATGDVASLRQVESNACRSCARADKYLEGLYSKGGSIRGGDFRIRNVTTIANPATGGWLVALGVVFGPQVVDNPAPEQDERPAGGRFPLNLQLSWQDDTWTVLEWSRGA